MDCFFVFSFLVRIIGGFQFPEKILFAYKKVLSSLRQVMV
jgi:hypothetical protein